MKTVKEWINPVHVRRIEGALQPQLRWLANRERVSVNMRLRTKFLLSLVLIIAGLTFSTLLIVGHAAQEQVQKALEQDTRNSVGTFQNVRAERQIELNRDAEILATLPSIKSIMADESPVTIQEASEEAWRSSDTELFALADWTGKIVALHSKTPGFPVSAATDMVEHARGTGAQGAWWFGQGHLYQVAAHPIEIGTSSQLNLGSVVVGREIDASVAREVGRLALCEIAFRYGEVPVVSSLSAAVDERMVTNQLRGAHPSGEMEIDGKRYLVSSVDLTPGSSPTLTLTVLKPADEALAFLTHLDNTLALLGGLAVFVGGMLVFFISSTFTKPLEQLCAGVHALEKGNFEYPLAPGTGDEVSEVTEAFARLRSTLQTNEEQKQMLGDQLRQAQKMEAVGRLAGGIAHDFNNLLMVIQGHAELLTDRMKPGESLRRNAEQIQEASQRATSLTRQLLAFSRKQMLAPVVLNVQAVVSDMGKILRRLIGEDVELVTVNAPDLKRVKADRSQIEQVIMNLAVNARDAMPRGGKLTIETANVEFDDSYSRAPVVLMPGRYVMLAVTDNGCGMDADTQAHIFEPFYTTKEKGKGTGLGLATVYGIVKQSGGYVWVYSEIGRGTTFKIYLPSVEEEVAPLEIRKAPASLPRGTETVLLVEDEEGVRELAKEYLESCGYKVLVAQNGQAAIDLVSKHSGPIDLIMTDIVMPGLSGSDLAKKVQSLRPDIRVVYMSGYTDQAIIHHGILSSDVLLLQKPFTMSTLAHKLREALSAKRIKS